MTSNGRTEHLQRLGAIYGRMGLAINFTDGISGDAAKANTRGWKRTERLHSAEQGRAIMATGLTRNPIVCLAASGLIGIDVDGARGRWLFRVLSAEVDFPTTVTVITGAGEHRWYRPPDGAPAGVVKVQLADRVVCSGDGYLVCPPAQHPSGHAYGFMPDQTPWDLEIATLPLATCERLAAATAEHRAHLRLVTGEINVGDRHEHLRQISWAMRRYSGASQAAIEAALLAENEARCSPPKPEHLVRDLAAYTYRNVTPIGGEDGRG